MSVVEAVRWLDRVAHEAELTVGCGSQRVSCYAQPFSGQVGMAVREPLLVYESHGCVRVNGSHLGQVRDPQGFGSVITARVEDARARRLSVGGVRLELDLPLPGDVAHGDVVEFHCDRLDFVG